jgi:hypothetical protein
MGNIQTDTMQPLERFPYTLLSHEKSLEEFPPVVLPTDDGRVVREIRVFDQRPFLSAHRLCLSLLFSPVVLNTVGEPVLEPVWTEGPLHLLINEFAKLSFQSLEAIMRGIRAGETVLFSVFFNTSTSAGRSRLSAVISTPCLKAVTGKFVNAGLNPKPT